MSQAWSHRHVWLLTIMVSHADMRNCCLHAQLLPACVIAAYQRCFSASEGFQKTPSYLAPITPGFTVAYVIQAGSLSTDQPSVAAAAVVVVEVVSHP